MRIPSAGKSRNTSQNNSKLLSAERYINNIIRIAALLVTKTMSKNLLGQISGSIPLLIKICLKAMKMTIPPKILLIKSKIDQKSIF